jgi:pyridoxamine 5'-phosphate oxidase
MGGCTFRARQECVKIHPMVQSAHDDPIERYLSQSARAQSRGLDTAPAALATADADGRPSVRIVLLRQVDSRGFVFYTNYDSRKAADLAVNPHAALCQHWPELEEQIRVEGVVERVAADQSDAYFAGRPRESQIGAWASDQSRHLDARSTLERRYAEAEARFDGSPVARPPFWGGYRIAPERIEFWYGRPGRLHERVLFTKTANGWKTAALFP